LSIQDQDGVLRSGWSSSVDDYAISGGWTHDGERLVVADSAGGVYVFNGKSGDIIWSLKEVHEGGALAISIHPSGEQFATAGQDGRVMIFQIAEKNSDKIIDVGNAWVENVAWSPDGELLACSCSKQVGVYSSTGDEIWRSNDHPSTVSTIAWSKKLELATACYGQVSFYDSSAGKLKQKLEWQGSLVSMVLSSDGDIVACGSQDNSVHFWRRSTGKDSKMSGYPFKPSALAFDDSGTFLATGGSEGVTVWNFKGDGPEGTTPLSLEHHSQPITCLSFANRGINLASGSRDGTIALWKVDPEKREHKLGSARVESSISKLYWRPDDRALAALDGQGNVNVWRI
jgi:WD40 repeat protein